jgi:hypothetical protein
MERREKQVVEQGIRMNLLGEIGRGGKRIVGAVQECNWLISEDTKKKWKLPCQT